MNLKFQPTRFKTLHDTQPVSTEWQTIVEEIRSQSHSTVTRAYRESLYLQDTLPATNDNRALLQRLKLQKDNLKGNQPAFVPSVSLEGGRSSKHIQGYSGFIMVDIDGILQEQVPLISQAVKNDPHTFLSYVTLSGRGVRVIARVKDVKNRKSFTQAWSLVNDYYARLTQCPIDEKCKNATRMSVICHDPEVVFRPEATVFTLSDEATATPGQKNKRPTKARTAASTVRRLVEEAGITYAPHQHNAYICRCLYWMNRFGVAQEDAGQWALDTFADYEADTHSVANIVRSCYACTDEHGSERLSHYLRRQDRQQRKVPLEAIETFINERLELRMNKLIYQLEYRPKESGQPWTRMTDLVENSLWCEMQRSGMNTDLNHIRTLLCSDFVEEYHPMKAYLDGLEPWDGTTDYIGQMAALVHCHNFTPDEFAGYFRRWLVGLVASALSEKVVNHIILVFIGRQGCYKSSFMTNILPPCLRQYYVSKTNSQRLNKDDLFSMTENLIINFEEIDSMQRNELNQLKAMTTTLHINERPAYGRNKMRLPHVASFCATGNNLQFLNDDTGTRRWVVAEIEHIENPWNTQLPYEGIYAQAHALLRNKFRYWFDDKEIDIINRRNRRFETPNSARELILTHYRKPLPTERGRYLTASDIVSRFSPHIRLNTAQVGRALRELGYRSIHTAHGNFWHLVERTANEIGSILPEPQEED